MEWRLSDLGRPRPPFIAALCAALVLSGVILAERAGYLALPTPSDDLVAAVLPGAVVALTNEERRDKDLGTLRASELLNRAAQLKADDMAEKSYYAHVSPDGTIPPFWLNKVGYRYSVMGENLVVDRESSDAVVSAWMGSHDHRENILNPSFTEIGVGVAHGNYKGRDTIYVVQMLARPLEERSAVVRTESPKPKPPVVPEPVAPVVIPVPPPTRTAATREVLVRAPEPEPVVRDTIAPILETIASSTLAEVPSIVASSSFPPPALALEDGSVIELETATTAPERVRPPFRVQMRAFVNAIGTGLREFFRPIL